MAGGFIASCRNPVTAAYVAEHAALGGVSMALDLGAAILDAEPRGSEAVIEAILAATRGTIVMRGRVTDVSIRYTSEAFDIGMIRIEGEGRTATIHVMNEYMAVDDGEGQRLATWPDVITTLDARGEPLSNNEVTEGAQIAVLHVDRSQIPLASSALDPSVYPPVEKALGIELARYAPGARP
jgi:hypothetical protein